MSSLELRRVNCHVPKCQDLKCDLEGLSHSSHDKKTHRALLARYTPLYPAWSCLISSVVRAAELVLVAFCLHS